MASTLPKLPIFEALKSHDPKTTAIVHYPSGRNFTYGELIHDVADATEELKGKAESNQLPGERVAFLVENGYDYVGAQLEQILLEKAHTDMRSDFAIYFCQPLNRRTAVYNLPKS